MVNVTYIIVTGDYSILRFYPDWYDSDFLCFNSDTQLEFVSRLIIVIGIQVSFTHIYMAINYPKGFFYSLFTSIFYTILAILFFYYFPGL